MGSLRPRRLSRGNGCRFAALLVLREEEVALLRHRYSINDPRPKGRGISEESELALLVQLPVA